MSSLALSTYIFPSNSWEFVKQQAEKYRSQAINSEQNADIQLDSPIYYVPQNLVSCIFGFLPKEDLGRASRVCKQWKQLASENFVNSSDLKELFLSVKIIDKTVWKTHVDLTALELDVNDEPPLDKRDISVLQRLLPSLKIEGKAGVTVLTLPKGFTFNKLVELAGSPKKGKATSFRYIWDHVSKELGDIPIKKTYRVVITNNVLKGSRNLSINEHRELVNKIGCKMPKVLEIATLAILTHFSSPEVTRLYNDAFTCCSEKVYEFNVVVGGYDESGLHVCDGRSYDYSDSLRFDFGINRGLRGGGALRKF